MSEHTLLIKLNQQLYVLFYHRDQYTSPYESAHVARTEYHRLSGLNHIHSCSQRPGGREPRSRYPLAGLVPVSDRLLFWATGLLPHRAPLPFFCEGPLSCLLALL